MGTLLSFRIFTLLFCTAAIVASGQVAVDNAPSASDQAPSIGTVIKQKLTDSLEVLALHYPKSVKRYYEHRRFEPAWIKPQGVTGQAWDAMLLFDCVLQYGLLHADYHPQELLYEQMDKFAKARPSGSNLEKAHFDIMLTDALLAFMNHLHYGKLNPRYQADAIDKEYMGGFDAGTALVMALQQDDFMRAVTGVQPSSAAYTYLQEYMKLVTSQYAGDCYEVPEGDIRKIALNMERLRWVERGDNTYIHINIPSGTLAFHRPDSSYLFRVVFGKPETPTPMIQSHIRYFYTAPEWKVPHQLFIRRILPIALGDSSFLPNNRFVVYDRGGNYIEPNAYNLQHVMRDPESYYARQSTGTDNSLGRIVFRFANPLGVYLQDTPDQQVFHQEGKALSNGNILVERADRLASLLLETEGKKRNVQRLQRSLSGYTPMTFTLRNAVPISITYLTCEIKGGLLVFYDDVYGLDPVLERAYYR